MAHLLTDFRCKPRSKDDSNPNLWQDERQPFAIDLATYAF